MDKLIQGLVAGVVQKKLVETLSKNKQFQRMSLQFRDKIGELTGEQKNNKNQHNYSNSRYQQQQQQQQNNHNHHYSHSGANSKNFQSTNNTAKYTNDIYENQRIYEQQQRLKQTNSYNINNSNNNNKNKNNNNYQQDQGGSFFSHLINGFKEEFKSESNSFMNKEDIPDKNKDKKSDKK